jgi:ABC-type branched-subunit amino acid transport system substrate-binding protein
MIRTTSRACFLFLLALVLAAGPPLPAGEGGKEDTAAAQSRAETATDKTGEAYGATPAELVPYRKTAEPYRRFFTTAPQFRGPGRYGPDPKNLKSVRIGLIAPLYGTREDLHGRDLKQGVELALEEANAEGGYAGLPFELVAKNDQALWGASSNTLVELAYGDEVWAIIGSIDSNSTHVALRAALKAEVMIVNVGSSDPTMTETGIPWIVRVTPDDRQTSYLLAKLLFIDKKFTRVAVLRSSNRYGRFGIKEFRDAARRLMRPLPMEVQFRPGQEDFADQLEKIAGAGVEAVLLWTDDWHAARIIRQMRQRGMKQPVFGTDRLVTEEFLDSAKEAAEGVTVTTWMNPSRNDPGWVGFQSTYRERFGQDPGVFGAYAYDAARMTVAAIRKVGLNRARIRDALMDIRSYRGVAGTMQFDVTSNNISPPRLASVKDGGFAFR